jgi:hypothetical protein
MVTYPVQVPRKSYRGSDQRRLLKVITHNRVAAELERYINGRIQSRAEETQTFLYYEIAAETGCPKDLVRDVLFGVDGGHNGLTVRKPAGAVGRA